VECILFIRHVLEETADVDSIRLHPHRFLEAVNIHGEFSLLIQAKNREILSVIMSSTRSRMPHRYLQL
jgi:two-component system heavy metal sensor histidine kinase CusS